MSLNDDARRMVFGNCHQLDLSARAIGSAACGGDGILKPGEIGSQIFSYLGLLNLQFIHSDCSRCHNSRFTHVILTGMWTVILLILSNICMTFAWYGHLKYRQDTLWKVILVSWGIAFFEYCLQVPANRIGAERFSPVQLKVIQEIITLCVFAVFTMLYFGTRLQWNHAAAALCLVAAAFFVFKPW